MLDCRLCTEYAKGKGCLQQDCPWLAERVEAKMDNVVQNISGTLYLNTAHRQRMNTLQKRLGYQDNKFFAAAYLLTATHDLYIRTEHCFCKQSIVFENAKQKA